MGEATDRTQAAPFRRGCGEDAKGERVKTRQLISKDEAVSLAKQHTSPCSDCPFSRKALKGWLGGSSPQEFAAIAHGDSPYDCHATDKQCAGIAIFRTNVCKSPRDPEALRLPRNTRDVFSTTVEFITHHTLKRKANP